MSDMDQRKDPQVDRLHSADRETKKPVRVYFCAECGEKIAHGSYFYRFPLGQVCNRCAERVDVDELLALLGFRGTYALLDAVGAERSWSA